MNPTFEALKMKAAVMQAEQESCEQTGDHLWGTPYLSQIAVVGEMRPGDSVACVRCGMRVPRSIASKTGQWA